MTVMHREKKTGVHQISALSLAGVLLLGSSLGHATDGPAAEEGRSAFRAGVILLKDPDGAKYEEALAQFKKAYKLLGSWKVLGNLGLCAMKVERDGEAIEAYEKYLASGGKEIDADERVQVERDLAALKAQVVKVHLDLPSSPAKVSDDRTTTQGAHVLNEYEGSGTSLDLALHPGHHAIRAAASGAPSWEVTLNPGSSVSHRFASGGPAVARVETPSGASKRVAGFVVGGVGVVGLAVGSYFGLRTFSQKNDAEPYCNGTQCTQPGVDLRNDAKSSATISTIAFAAGVAAVGVGTFLVVTSPSKSSESASARAPSVLWMAPAAGPTGGAIAVGGAF